MRLRLLADRRKAVVAERVNIEAAYAPDARTRAALVKAAAERDELQALNAAADAEG